jgi:GTPase SAR1 family protein
MRFPYTFIADTAGQEEYSALTDQYVTLLSSSLFPSPPPLSLSLTFSPTRRAVRTGHGFLIMYAINSRASFDSVRTFYSTVNRTKDQDAFPACVIVGNKCDLVEERYVEERGEGREWENLNEKIGKLL